MRRWYNLWLFWKPPEWFGGKTLASTKLIDDLRLPQFSSIPPNKASEKNWPRQPKPCGCDFDRVCLQHEKERMNDIWHRDHLAFATLPAGGREWTIACTEEGHYLVYGTRIKPGESVTVKEL